MGLFWLVAYCVLVGLAVAQAVLMVLQTWEHRRFARSRFRALRRARPSGKAMVFAPCKGIDDDLEENLRRLFHQDYDDYEITFIVEDVSDPAYGRIRRLIADHRHVVCHLVIAGRAKESGQKVHNLRMATRQLRPEIEFLVFVDSDARPRREWLRGLIGRLADRGNRDVGAVTGYRWLVPTRPTPANHLLYGVNCGIAALFGPKGFYPIWGGSWAIRRTVFESIGLRQEWKGTLSDDLVASNVLRRNKLGVRFEPAGMVTSPTDGGLRQTFSFLRRQYLIGRFYTPRAWALGLASAALPNLAWWISLGAVIQGLAAGAAVWLPAGGLRGALPRQRRPGMDASRPHRVVLPRSASRTASRAAIRRRGLAAGESGQRGWGCSPRCWGATSLARDHVSTFHRRTDPHHAPRRRDAGCRTVSGLPPRRLRRPRCTLCSGIRGNWTFRRISPAAWASASIPTAAAVRDKVIRYFYRRDRRPVALLFAHLAAIFRRLGHGVEYAEDRIVPGADLYVFNPSLITLDLERAAIAEVLRAQPAARVLVVGTVASVMPEAFADLGVTVVKGEAEQLLWKLDEVLARPGATVQLGVIEDLDALPFPDWSPFRPRRFRIGYDFWKFPTALVQQSRGCTFKCNYCPYLLLDNGNRLAQSRGRGRRDPPRHPALGLPLVQVPRSAVRR